MTCDERLEKLLNRAGQTISDLPGPFGYTAKQEEDAMEAAADFGGDDVLILHLTDVIDRLEWALDKVVRERDYLAERFGDAVCDCDICMHAENDTDDPPYVICALSENRFEFAGIPEDWRVDDD